MKKEYKPHGFHGNKALTWVLKDPGHWSEFSKVCFGVCAESKLTRDEVLLLSPPVIPLYPVTKRASEKNLCCSFNFSLSVYLGSRRLKCPTRESLPHCSLVRVLGLLGGFVNVNKGQRPQRIEMFFYILELFFDKLYIFYFLVEVFMPVCE